MSSISIAAAVGAANLQGVLLPHAALLLGVFVPPPTFKLALPIVTELDQCLHKGQPARQDRELTLAANFTAGAGLHGLCQVSLQQRSVNNSAVCVIVC